jgi:hypothetical protein
MESIMRFACVLMFMMAVFAQSAAMGAGWTHAISITSLSVNDIGGEVVQFSVSDVVENSAHCTDATGYAIRDPATLRSALALLTSAFITGKQVDLFLTGACDQTGMPAVVGVALRK